MANLRILSLGAGVQSSCIAMMAAHGEIEPYDHILFADTGFEPKVVYNWLEWLEEKLDKAGMKITKCQSGNIYDDLMNAVTQGTRFSAIPYWIKSPSGSIAPGPRHCTTDYKVKAKEKKIREILGYKPHQRWTDHVDMHLGISSDEAHRAKPSKEHWETTHYPLIELDMSRWDCEMWFVDHGYPIPPKSACGICPYATHDRWLEIKRTDPETWQKAVELDNALRHGMQKRGLNGEVYLHRSGYPLEQMEEINGEQLGMSLDDLDLYRFDCAGMCGV